MTSCMSCKGRREHSGQAAGVHARRYTGAGLWNRMSTSFGYLNKVGYGGHVFPVVIGETGSAYTDVRLLPCTSLLPRECRMHALQPAGPSCSCAVSIRTSRAEPAIVPEAWAKAVHCFRLNALLSRSRPFRCSPQTLLGHLSQHACAGSAERLI